MAAAPRDRFEATADLSRLGEADAVIICVPTPLGRHREPDLTYVERSADDIAKTLRRGQLVVLESTTYPGTTREVCSRELEATGPAVRAGLLPGLQPRARGPRQPGPPHADDPQGRRRPRRRRAASWPRALYGRASCEVVPVSSPEVAEACKILENTYRAVNIALVNELKVVFDRMGIDVWEVIDAAKTKPFGFQAFYPGPGLGGHCIPIDPFYLTWVAREYGLPTRFIELAGEINTAMPHYVVDRVAAALNDRGQGGQGQPDPGPGHGVQEGRGRLRESPGFELMELLEDRGRPSPTTTRTSPPPPHAPLARPGQVERPADRRVLATTTASWSRPTTRRTTGSWSPTTRS